MTHGAGDGHSGDREAILRRVEKMLSAGRITQDEATRVRAAAEGGGDVDASVQAIRIGHARQWLDSQVEGGHLSPAEADNVLEQLRRGDDPSVIRQLRRRGSS